MHLDHLTIYCIDQHAARWSIKWSMVCSQNLSTRPHSCILIITRLFTGIYITLTNVQNTYQYLLRKIKKSSLIYCFFNIPVCDFTIATSFHRERTKCTIMSILEVPFPSNTEQQKGPTHENQVQSTLIPKMHMIL